MSYRLASSPLKTSYGHFEMSCFNWEDHEDENILGLTVPWGSSVPLVRMQSACFTAEIFRSTDCDCHEQLETSLDLIQQSGGLFIYLLQDGRGAGIYPKTRALELGSTKGLDTADAYDFLGISRDPRIYHKAVMVLRHFGVAKLKLPTNNPRKISGLEREGIQVIRMPLEIEPTEDSLQYLRTKKTKMGHMLGNIAGG